MKEKILAYLSFKQVAVAAFILALLVWISGGARAGWTVTSTTTMALDEITGLEYPVITEGLVPGIEFLAVGFFAFVVLLTIDAFFAWKTAKG